MNLRALLFCRPRREPMPDGGHRQLSGHDWPEGMGMLTCRRCGTTMNIAHTRRPL